MNYLTTSADTAVKITALENDVERLNRVNTSLETRVRDLEAMLSSFRGLMHDLPWEEINTGCFQPQVGCSEVARVLEILERLGCEPSIINAGLEKAYYVYASVPVEVKIYIECANSEEEAERQAEDILSCTYFEARDIEDVEFDTYHANFHTVEEA